jgi:DNA topoisomerase VI subunit B
MERTAKTRAGNSVEDEHATPVMDEAVDGSSHSTKSGASSNGSRRLMEIEERVDKAVRRMTRALDKGVETYSEHRDKSKATRKDGPLVDFIENVSSGVAKTVSEASPIIHDVAETFNTRVVRSQVRKVARTFGSLPFMS